MEPTPVLESRTLPAIHSSQAFEDHTLPHLDRAYRLARQLTRNSQDAMDVVQEAYLRALRFYRDFGAVMRFHGFSGSFAMFSTLRSGRTN
jgi:DNA-directed RNA polymerase specialized sigma24 family protein